MGISVGVEKTLGQIRQAFYWPGMVDTVKRYCLECDECAAAKLSRTSNKSPLGQYFVGEPWAASVRGNKNILVMADWFTKWTLPEIELLVRLRWKHTYADSVCRCTTYFRIKVNDLSQSLWWNYVNFWM